MSDGNASHDKQENQGSSPVPQYPSQSLSRPQLPLAGPSTPSQAMTTTASPINSTLPSPSLGFETIYPTPVGRYSGSTGHTTGFSSCDGNPSQQHQISFNDPILPQPLPPPQYPPVRPSMANVDHQQSTARSGVSPVISPIQTRRANDLPPLRSLVRNINETPGLGPPLSPLQTQYQPPQQSWQTNSPRNRVISPSSPRLQSGQQHGGAESIIPPLSMMMSQGAEVYGRDREYSIRSSVFSGNPRGDTTNPGGSSPSGAIGVQHTLSRDHFATPPADAPPGTNYGFGVNEEFPTGPEGRRNFWSTVLGRSNTNDQRSNLSSMAMETNGSAQGGSSLEPGNVYGTNAMSPRYSPAGPISRGSQGMEGVQPYRLENPPAGGYGSPTLQGSVANPRGGPTGSSPLRRKKKGNSSRADRERTKFKCPRCGNLFGLKGNLKQHILTVHEGIRPFGCSQCSMSFSTRFGRKQHILTVHEGRRPYACGICGATFGQRSHLRRHHRVVHKMEMPLEDIENELTSAAGVHMNFGVESTDANVRSEISREDNCACVVCEERFASRSLLRMHIRRTHADTSDRSGTMDSCEVVPSGHNGMHVGSHGVGVMHH